MSKLKLPRQIETDPRHEAIEKLIAQDLRPLWEKGSLTVPHIPFLPAFEKALKHAQLSKQLERGLEHIDVMLNAQQKGLDALNEKQGTEPAYRISRLLIIPDDCTERFYRTCEATLFRHGDRVLGLRINVPYTRLAESLFGEDALVKVLLVSDKESVTNVLFSLVSP